ncbi:MAG: aminoacyl-tRNA hydrolase [Candidatus Krumholzibacteria bacterium]
MPPRLIFFGLGNPGRQYRVTRHNMGFLVLEALASARRLAWDRASKRYTVATERNRDDGRLVLIKPETFVNRAGDALREFASHTPFEPNELIVVADDIDLPLGQLRLRRRGGHGGHNGLKSIISALETTDFPRLRLGVGPVPRQVDPADFVLDRFDADEKPAVERQVNRVLACIEDILAKGFEHAMNVHNTAID